MDETTQNGEAVPAGPGPAASNPEPNPTPAEPEPKRPKLEPDSDHTQFEKQDPSPEAKAETTSVKEEEKEEPEPVFSSPPVHEMIGGLTVRQYLNKHLTQHLLAGLRHVSKTRPEDPLQTLGEYLIEQAKAERANK